MDNQELERVLDQLHIDCEETLEILEIKTYWRKSVVLVRDRRNDDLIVLRNRDDLLNVMECVDLGVRYVSTDFSDWVATEPLLEALRSSQSGVLTHREIAELLGIDRRSVVRHLNTRLMNAHLADKYACMVLGTHPSAIWPQFAGCGVPPSPRPAPPSYRHLHVAPEGA